MPMPLKCRCEHLAWEIHPEKIVCLHCKFTEHFVAHETMGDIITRMRMQGSYFLDKDKDKLQGVPVVQITGYNYR